MEISKTIFEQLNMKGGDNVSQFGEWMKKRRESLHYSLRDLARESKCSPTHISDIERGDVERPSRKLAVNIAIALGVTPNEGLIAAGYAPEGNNNHDDAEFERLRCILKGLPPERRKRAIDALELLVSV